MTRGPAAALAQAREAGTAGCSPRLQAANIDLRPAPVAGRG